MLAIMLVLYFKGMQCISKFVGLVQARVVVVDYDQKVLMPMLHKAWNALHPAVNGEPCGVVEVCSVKAEVDEFCLFGAAESTEEATEGTIVKELSLFRRLVIEKEDLEMDRFSGGR